MTAWRLPVATCCTVYAVITLGGRGAAAYHNLGSKHDQLPNCQVRRMHFSIPTVGQVNRRTARLTVDPAASARPMFQVALRSISTPAHFNRISPQPCHQVQTASRKSGGAAQRPSLSLGRHSPSNFPLEASMGTNDEEDTAALLYPRLQGNEVVRSTHALFSLAFPDSADQDGMEGVRTRGMSPPSAGTTHSSVTCAG